jgi:hypothetical protein
VLFVQARTSALDVVKRGWNKKPNRKNFPLLTILHTFSHFPRCEPAILKILHLISLFYGPLWGKEEDQQQRTSPKQNCCRTFSFSHSRKTTKRQTIATITSAARSAFKVRVSG